MKKSNKILLGGLLTIILILVAVHVALYARYKAGNYKAYTEKQTEEATNVKEFGNARQIDIRNLKNVIVRVGDRLRVEQFGEDANNIMLVERGGAVQLSVKDSTNNEQVFDYVIVYIPENSLVTSYNSYLRVEGLQGQSIKGLNFSTSGGYLNFQQQKNMVQIDSLNVDATNNATIELNNARVEKLSVRLNGSELIDKQAVINRLNLNADSASRINIQSKNLLKLTTNTTAYE